MNIGTEYLKTVTQQFGAMKITTEKAIDQLTEGVLFYSDKKSPGYPRAINSQH